MHLNKFLGKSYLFLCLFSPDGESLPVTAAGQAGLRPLEYKMHVSVTEVLPLGLMLDQVFAVELPPDRAEVVALLRFVN